MACFEVTVKGIILREGKILLCKTPTGIVLPGGRKEEGESLEETLKRELKEELGVNCKSFSLIYAQAYKTPSGKEKVGIYYLVEIEGEPKPLAEVKEIFWVGEDKIDFIEASKGFKDLLLNLFQLVKKFRGV